MESNESDRDDEDKRVGLHLLHFMGFSLSAECIS